jgi:rubrerythrin
MTRRELLRLAGAAALLAGCGDGEGSSRPGEAAPPPDVGILNRVLDLENTAIAAYAAGARLMTGDVLTIGRRLLAQEREHAAALERAIRRLGGVPREPKTAGEYARSFPRLRDQHDVLRFAVDLENLAVRAYEESLPKLTMPELRRSAAAILTNEAEHISVLLGAQGKPQVPEPFVTGLA